MNKLVPSLIIVLIVAILGGSGYFAWKLYLQPKQPHLRPVATSTELKKFTSAEDFKNYVQLSADSSFNYARSTSNVTAPGEFQIEEIGSQVGLGSSDTGSTTLKGIDRVSTTNVQIQGIDEPDIVKTDGKNIYYAAESTYYYALGSSAAPMKAQQEDRVAAPDTPVVSTNSDNGITNANAGNSNINTSPTLIAPYQPVLEKPVAPTASTRIISALPPETMAKLAELNITGELLLDKNNLIVLSSAYQNGATTAAVTSYDISNPTLPKKIWEAKLAANDTVAAARLRQGKIYLITQHYIDQAQPCPYVPLTIDAKNIEIACADIYHPSVAVPVDSSYTALEINPQTGVTDRQLTVVGSTGGMVVSMSDRALYIAYAVQADPSVWMFDFMKESMSDLLSPTDQEKLNKLEGYDISAAAKMVELEQILGRLEQTLNTNEQSALQKKMEDRGNAYVKAHQREFSRTNLARIDLDTFSLDATGEVPGTLLNQYAIDEYQNHLRVATTSNGSWAFGSSNSVNDVYVLDLNLKVKGQIEDLGVGEQIYSVRFVGAVGYLVTFRQTDPFYVLDLSDPAKPVKSGELKIPGYSSYLHPLSETLILGIGEEARKTKMSLFDVSKPESPTEIDKLTLSDYSWSEVQNNPHAFLQDSQQKVFFLPAGTRGLIVSYADNKLTTVKDLTGINAKRALYINDVLYIVGQDQIVALSEKDWTQLGTLSLQTK